MSNLKGKDIETQIWVLTFEGPNSLRAEEAGLDLAIYALYPCWRTQEI